MALIDIRCTACLVTSEVVRVAADWPATPACPACGAPTEQIHLPASARPLPPAVVAYRMPDGSYRFPGDPNGPAGVRYAHQGGIREEYRGWAEVRTFESRVNDQERSKIARRVERQQRALEAGERIRRSDFHHGLHHGFQIPERAENAQGEVVSTGRMKTVHLSDRAREIARHLMRTNNRKGVRSFEPGFHVEAYSYDRTNRDAARDAQGRRRPE